MYIRLDTISVVQWKLVKKHTVLQGNLFHNMSHARVSRSHRACDVTNCCYYKICVDTKIEYYSAIFRHMLEHGSVH